MSSGALFVEPLAVATAGLLTSTNAGAGTDPAAWDSGATYALDVQAQAGDSVWQSVQAGNTNHDPEADDGTWWIRVGSINSLRMFDLKVGSQTENPDTLVVVVTPVSVVGVVSVRNVAGLSVTVEQSTTEEGVVYSKSVNLDEPVADWYEFFFSPITLQTEAVFTGLAPFTDAVYTVTIDNTGGMAKCGELLMGPVFDAGITAAGVTDGIDDYSLITPDDFGVRDIVERDFAENMDLTVYVHASRSPTLKRLLTQNRARPILVIASDARPDAQVYGLAETWRRVLSYPDYDVFNITMKGLT